MFTQSKETRKIDSLEEMELIVKDHRNLFWDGWNVFLVGARSSVLNPKARKVDGQWRIVNRYPVGESGWEIPVESLQP